MKLVIHRLCLVLLFWGLAGTVFSQSLMVNSMPSWSTNHTESNFELNDSVILWSTAFGGIPPYTDTLRIDGIWIPLSVFTQDPFPVTQPDHYLYGHFFSRKFAFTSCGFHTIEWKITDGAGVNQTRQSLILVHNDPPFHIKVNRRIERGLLWLYKSCHFTTGDMVFWPRSETSGYMWDEYTFAGSAAAILAFEENGHLYTNDTVIDPFAVMIRKGLRFLFSNAGQYNIYNHDDGTGVKVSDLFTYSLPVSTTCNTGLLRGSYLYNYTDGTYANSFGLMAIALAHADSVQAGNHYISNGCFTGWPYKEFLRDALDYIYFYQGDFDNRGGWGYYLDNYNNYYDGSLEQWPCLVLAAANARLGMDSPDWVKLNVDDAYTAITDGQGGCGYASPYSSNVGKTGGMLASYAWTGKYILTGDAAAVAALEYVESHYGNAGGYGDQDGWAGNFYSMYGLKKGLALQEVDEVTYNDQPRNWYHDMVAWLTAQQLAPLPPSFVTSYQNLNFAYGQYPDGSWEDIYFGQTALATAHALLILTPNVFDLPPAAPTPVYGICKGDSMQLTATSGSVVEWFSIPPGFYSSQQTIWVSPDSDMVYYAFVYNEIGCILEVDSNRIFIWPPVDPMVNYNDPVCADDTLMLTTEPGWTYSWSGPGGFSSGVQFPQIPDVQAADQGCYFLTMYDEHHCPAFDSVMVEIRPLPVPVVQTNSPVCSNDTLTLQASGGVSYSWAGPAGFSSSQADSILPGFQLPMAGTYVVTVSSDYGCQAVDSVAVAGLPAPNAGIQSNSPVCQGDTVLIQASGGNSYIWYGPPGFSTSGNQLQVNNAQPGQSGTYWVVVGDLNQCTDTAYVVVEVHPGPVVLSMLKTHPLCHGESSGSIQVMASGGTSLSYTWSCCPGQDTPLLTNLPAGTYNLTITSVGSCSLDTSAILTEPGPYTIVSEVGPDTCRGQGRGSVNVTLVSGQNPPYTYAWSSGQNTPGIGNLYSGIYTLTLSDQSGCDTLMFFEVGFLSDPAIGVDPASAELCLGDSILLTANGATWYRWSPSFEIEPDTGAMVEAFPTQTSYMMVVGTDEYHCIDTAFTYLMVHPSPEPDLGPDLWLQLGESANLSLPPGYNSYLWSTGDTLPLIMISDTGQYWVWVSDGWCSGTDSVHVYEILDIWVPSAFTPNQDERNDYFFPVCLSCTEMEWYVFDRWGGVIFSSGELNSKWDGTLAGETCPAGVYTYLIKYHKPSPGHSDGKGALRGIVVLLR